MSLQVENIKVDSIAPYPFQDTPDGYATDVDFAFIESVRENGILQPILVAFAKMTPDIFGLYTSDYDYVGITALRLLKGAV